MKGKIREQPLGFYNWHLSRFVVLSLLKYGDMSQAYDLLEADHK